MNSPKYSVEDIYDLFDERKLLCGRICSAYKNAPRGQVCVWNANVLIKTHGKVWFGDININKDGDKLKEIAVKIEEPLYVLREKDCRFDTENDSIELLISKSVWDTTKK